MYSRYILDIIRIHYLKLLRTVRIQSGYILDFISHQLELLRISNSDLIYLQEINKTGGTGKVDADEASKYRQLLVRTLHSCCIRFPDVASNVIPLLMEFLSDSVNDEASAADVLVFTREAMAKFAHLRATIIEKLLEAFNTIKSAKISRAALWILGEYCEKATDIQAVMNEIRQSLGEIPIGNVYKLSARWPTDSIVLFIIWI